jgi:hypothetical protein
MKVTFSVQAIKSFARVFLIIQKAATAVTIDVLTNCTTKTHNQRQIGPLNRPSGTVGKGKHAANGSASNDWDFMGDHARRDTLLYIRGEIVYLPAPFKQCWNQFVYVIFHTADRAESGMY